MINSFKNPAIMRILRTTERYEAGWREQNFIPDDEAHRPVSCKKQAIIRNIYLLDFLQKLWHPRFDINLTAKSRRITSRYEA